LPFYRESVSRTALFVVTLTFSDLFYDDRIAILKGVFVAQLTFVFVICIFIDGFTFVVIVIDGR